MEYVFPHRQQVPYTQLDLQRGGGETGLEKAGEVCRLGSWEMT